MALRFLLHCLKLALPVLGLFTLVAWVDPYELYHGGGPVEHARKKKNLYHSGRTMSFSNMLWKLIEYRRNPAANVLLGDSRLTYFDTDSLARVTGDHYYNFGIPGGNYVTMDHLFRFADSLAHLDHVYLQVSFRGCNTIHSFDSYKEPAAILKEPWSYVYNRRVIEAAGLNLYSTLFPNAVEYDVHSTDHWQQVVEAERSGAEEFQMDSTVFMKLRRVAERCRAEGAQLVLVEYPTHPEIQAVMRAAGTGPLRATYLAELRNIAPVIDLDQPGLFPADRSFWRDPLHLTVKAQQRLIQHIWVADPSVP